MQIEPSALFAIHLVAAAAAPIPPGPLELLVTYLPMAGIVLVAWMMLSALKKNDRVLTTSGIYGTVANVDREADRVSLRVDDAGSVKIAVTLSSIAKVLGDGSSSDS